ncbi:hypothetical protein PDJAM_G00088910 [Pangasius djambal]|uniref:Uncharacterized protein n=1 Tax=Pangasius djambal TaxID=1691987 RepID=A0ACC5Z5G8_9TELE|nr:hypothetical protein [Pangasius djambal]
MELTKRISSFCALFRSMRCGTESQLRAFRLPRSLFCCQTPPTAAYVSEKKHGLDTRVTPDLSLAVHTVERLKKKKRIKEASRLLARHPCGSSCSAWTLAASLQDGWCGSDASHLLPYALADL